MLALRRASVLDRATIRRERQAQKGDTRSPSGDRQRVEAPLAVSPLRDAPMPLPPRLDRPATRDQSLTAPSRRRRIRRGLQNILPAGPILLFRLRRAPLRV